MRRNSNYFGDVSQFFLRAKKEENFVLDAKIKNSVREKLSLKINEIKNPVSEKTQEEVQPVSNYSDYTIKRIVEEATVKRDFWSIWKRQLISVPASLAALTLIVFAANNFNFTLQPKETFLPKTEKTSDLAASLLDTKAPEENTADSAMIADAINKQPEANNPDILVLDIGSMGENSSGETRSLNKYQPAENIQTSSGAASQPTNQQNTADNQTASDTTQTQSEYQTQPQTNTETSTAADSNVDSQTEENINRTTTQNVQTENIASNQTIASQDQTGTQTTQPQIASETAETSSTQTASLNVTDNTLNTNLSTDNQLPDYNLTLPETETPATPAIDEIINNNPAIIVNPDLIKSTTTITALSEYQKNAGVYINTDKNKLYSVNYYKASSLTREPIFDKMILTDLTANKTPSAVNVYYLSGTRVLVEVVENGIKKLFLYEQRDGAWTVIKYEKN